MTWRNQLQQASFRGVDFFVDSHGYAVGRRNVVHQYPFQDEAYVEDLGQEADSFSINGYILQKPPLFNYFKDRDKLIEALKEEGPGILVHRYLGEKRVALVGQARISETFQEGGMARFQMNFVEAGKNQFPKATTDPVGAMDFAALDSINRAIDAFGDVYDTAQSVVDDINDSMAMIKSTLRTLKSVPASVISEAVGLVTSATTLISSVLSTPCDLASAIVGGFDSFLFAAGMLSDTVSRGITGNCSGRTQNPDDAGRDSDVLSKNEGVSISTAAANLSTFGAIVGSDDEDVNEKYGGGLPPITVASPDSAAKEANRLANINMVRLTGLAQAMRIAVRTLYNSQQDTESQLLYISNLLDDFLDYLGLQAGDSTLINFGVPFSNDEVFQAAKNMKSVFKKSMDTIGASLARDVEFTPDVDVLPTLKLAYDQYEDLSRESEIMTRNEDKIFHPGFIPNSKTISILSE